MAKEIFCQKLQTELEELDEKPFPGKLGDRIYKNISKIAWQLWTNRQTRLINELRLNTMDLECREFLKREMEKFLFEPEEDEENLENP